MQKGLPRLGAATPAAAAAVPAVVAGPGCSSGGGGNNPNPTYTEAILNAQSYNLACPGTTAFDGSASTAANGDPLTYTWTFTDDYNGEVVSTEPSSQAVYQLAADSSTPFQMGTTYTVTLTVEDTEGKKERRETKVGERQRRQRKGWAVLLQGGRHKLPCAGLRLQASSSLCQPRCIQTHSQCCCPAASQPLRSAATTACACHHPPLTHRAATQGYYHVVQACLSQTCMCSAFFITNVPANTHPSTLVVRAPVLLLQVIPHQPSPP